MNLNPLHQFFNMVLLIFQVCTFNKIFLNFFFNFAGCKESQFYSLPFGQAVVSMYYLKSHFNKSEKIFWWAGLIYYSVIWISPKKSLAHWARKKQNSLAQLQNQLVSAYQIQLSFLAASDFATWNRLVFNSNWYWSQTFLR